MSTEKFWEIRDTPSSPSFQGSKRYRPVSHLKSPLLVNTTEPTLYLAGPVTDCPDWQSIVADKLQDLDITILNPRNATLDWDIDKSIVPHLRWKDRYLGRSSCTLVWFPEKFDDSIALMDLEKLIRTNTSKILIGVHPAMSGSKALIRYLAFEGYPLIASNLLELIDQVRAWHIDWVTANGDQR